MTPLDPYFAAQKMSVCPHPYSDIIFSKNGNSKFITNYNFFSFILRFTNCLIMSNYCMNIFDDISLLHVSQKLFSTSDFFLFSVFCILLILIRTHHRRGSHDTVSFTLKRDALFNSQQWPKILLTLYLSFFLFLFLFFFLFSGHFNILKTVYWW